MTTNTKPDNVTALAVRQEHHVAPASWEPESLPAGIELAELLAKGNLLPGPLRGKPADVLVVLMTGRELGLSPMQSIRGVHVIDGKGVLSADMLVALCKRRKDVCAWFRMVESTAAVATYETLRHGDPSPVRMSFTIEEAKAANLAGKDTWKKFPAAMLRARCSAALARAVYPDLCAGLYDADELEPRGHSNTTVAPGPLPQAFMDSTAETVSQQETVEEAPPEPAPADDTARAFLADHVADLKAAQTEAEVESLAITHGKNYPQGHALRGEFLAAYKAAMARVRTTTMPTTTAN